MKKYYFFNIDLYQTTIYIYKNKKNEKQLIYI